MKFFRKKINWDSPDAWKQMGIRDTTQCAFCGHTTESKPYCNEKHRLQQILLTHGWTHELSRAIRMVS